MLRKDWEKFTSKNSPIFRGTVFYHNFFSTKQLKLYTDKFTIEEGGVRDSKGKFLYIRWIKAIEII